MSARWTRKACALSLAGVMIILSLWALGSVSALELDEIEPETGTTDAFGGGAYVAFRLRDAGFAVLYGTEEQPNFITIAAENTRYLGHAEVWSDGELVRSGPIAVRSVHAHQLRFALEWRDSDGDGVQRDCVPENNVTAFEAVKGVTLHRAWTMAGVEEVGASEGRAWRFSLRAEDLGYDRVWEQGIPRNGTPEDGAVEAMEFTFHVTITEKEVKAEVPRFNITVERTGMRREVNVERTGSKEYNGTALRCGFKYDHLIEGWDFESSESRLAIATRGFLGFQVPSDAPEWMRERFKERFMDRHGAEGTARFCLGTQNMSMNGTWTGVPRLLTRDEVGFDDNWQRVGRFAWTSQLEVTNMGETQNLTVRYQVHHGDRLTVDGFGGEFSGFAIGGAFLYPAGERLYHDPLMETDALFLGVEGVLPPGIAPWVIAVSIGIAVVVLVGVLAYKRFRRVQS
ncbi:MAG: hypothetical protein AB1665_07975 [Candidatus Thermoplasmatota archaeon]